MRVRFGAFAKEMVNEARKEWRHLRLVPVDAMGFLTYRCTSRCKTCNIWKRGGSQTEGELTAEQWRRVIDRLARAGVKSFEVFGGDALLRKDAIFEVIARASQRGMRTYFPTNANLCDRETVQRLVEAGLGTIYLSIDDLGEDHDAIRGVEGTFARVEQTLEYLAEARGCAPDPKIIVCTTLSRMNFRAFPRLLRFLEGYPVDAVYPRALGEFSQANVDASVMDGRRPEPYFASPDGDSHLMSEAEYEEFAGMVEGLKRNPGSVYVSWRAFYTAGPEAFTRGEYTIRRCHIATSFVTVNANGDVVPCPFFGSYVLGNLDKEPLEDIWGNRKHRKFVQKQQARRIPLCRNCNMRVYYPSMLETLGYYKKRLVELGPKAVSKIGGA